VLIAIPGGACRTDAPVDAEIPDSDASSEPEPGVFLEAPFVRGPATVDVSVVSAVVPVVVEAPSDSELPGALAGLAVSPGAADDGEAESAPGELPSSAHATPGLLATATPTPNATANPPTRPTNRPALTTTPLIAP
jgi:hypothetical protein